MSKYIKQEDADKTLCDLVREYNREARGLESSGAFEALSRIRLIPAADVAPVVHGKWVTPTVINGRSFRVPHCSACDGVPCGVDENTKYCPNCGAKMEVGE